MAALAFASPRRRPDPRRRRARLRAPRRRSRTGGGATPGCGIAPTAEPHPATLKPVCLTASETRDEVKAHKLLEPFAALKSAAQQRKAEALSAKLCHTGDEFIYEITLLHRDGRLTHVQMEAGTGKLIARPCP